MHRPRVTLYIFGMRTYLGREVARFGRAMGHRIMAVVEDSIPPFDEPWMHGVHWLTGHQSVSQAWSTAPPAAIIYCDTALWNGRQQRFRRILWERPTQLLGTAQTLKSEPKFVFRSTVDQPLLSSYFTAFHRRTERRLMESDLSTAILRLPLLFGPDQPDSVLAMMALRALHRLSLTRMPAQSLAAMRVEQAALAALRSALEPDIYGVLSPDQIGQIGDVMIPQ